jgi:hypothetical protein
MTRRIGLAGAADLTDFIDSCLQPMQRCIAAAGLDQRVIAGVCDSASSSIGPVCRLKFSAQLIKPT